MQEGFSEEGARAQGPVGRGETLAVGPLGTLSASERPAVLPEWRKARLGAEGHESAMGPWARGSGLPEGPLSLSLAQPRRLPQCIVWDGGAAWPQLLLCTWRAWPVGEAVAPDTYPPLGVAPAEGTRRAADGSWRRPPGDGPPGAGRPTLIFRGPALVHERLGPCVCQPPGASGIFRAPPEKLSRGLCLQGCPW